MRGLLKSLALKSIPPLEKMYRQREELIKQVQTLTYQLQSREERVSAPNSTQEISLPPVYQYDSDWLRVWGKNLSSLNNPRFVEAYTKGADPGVNIAFRAYICCWAAEHALMLPGDFVECGVNEGWISRTICHYLDLNKTDKNFYLFDTYAGIPPDQISENEAERAALHNYTECYELAKSYFAPFRLAHLVRGKVPDTLTDVLIEKVSYLSIDMNIEKPERAAIEFFWPKLSQGAIVILDDYGFEGYERQHESMDEFAESVGTPILTLPTGQGLMLKR